MNSGFSNNSKLLESPEFIVYSNEISIKNTVKKEENYIDIKFTVIYNYNSKNIQGETNERI